MNTFKSEETKAAHLRGAKKGGSVKAAKGFAYMKIHDPERLREISAAAGRMPRRKK